MRKWSRKEIQYLKDNYMKMKYSEIGKVLNKTTLSVGGKIIKLKLHKQKLHTPRPKGLKKKCKYCGRVIEIDKLKYPLSLETWNKMKYCSRNCYFKDRRVLGLFKFCKHCGKKIERDKLGYNLPLKAWNKRKYCNNSCSARDIRPRRPRGLTKKCAYCKKLIERDKLEHYIDLKTWDKRKYCSIDCFYKARKSIRRV